MYYIFTVRVEAQRGGNRTDQRAAPLISAPCHTGQLPTLVFLCMTTKT